MQHPYHTPDVLAQHSHATENQKKSIRTTDNSTESINFAAAMQSKGLLNINLSKASAQAECIHAILDDTFFSSLDQEEILGGRIDVALKVKAPVHQIYTVEVGITGTVVVSCDRCLEPLELDIEAQEELHVKDGDQEETDPWDLIYAEGLDSTHDFGWDIYEIAETSLPIQRVHAENECNPDMVGRIMKDDADLD